MANTIEKIRPVLADMRTELLQKANVVATGIGYKITGNRQTDELAIVCSVETKKPLAKLRLEDRIPASISGITTDVVATGPISIFQDRTDRFRPAPGGVSIGHYQITAGTLGCLVQKHGELYILSNNHVIANSNDATAGDPILQPGPHDGGRRPDDEIAQLSEFVPIVFEGDRNGDGNGACGVAGFFVSVLNAMAVLVRSKTRLKQYRLVTPGIDNNENRVDCAIARPNASGDVLNEILDIGAIRGLAEAVLGLDVKKSGRTTGLTTGTIQQVDVSVRVNFGASRVALFTDQVMAGSMSQGGDSGSVVLDLENNAVGLLFAGSASTTIINRIQNVFTSLDVSLV
jgi:hypothetical protein